VVDVLDWAGEGGTVVVDRVGKGRRKNERSGSVTILVSTCLVGVHTRFDGGSNRVDGLANLVRSGRAVCLCPEQLGGLTTPREPAEIEPEKTARDVLEGNARVLTITGKDVTRQFVDGAKEALAFCQEMGIGTAIMAAASPSCGSRETCDGTHSGTLRPGKGVTAELLAQNGIVVYNEMNYVGQILNREQDPAA
jgi:uncharacterized protein YbbK (DUF523 family)